MLRTRSERIRCARCLGKIADEALHSGKALHAFELGAEHIGRILEPDDQVGDIGSIIRCWRSTSWMRAFSMSNCGSPSSASASDNFLQHHAGCLDLGAHLVDDGSGFLDFRVKALDVGHARIPCNFAPVNQAYPNPSGSAGHRLVAPV
jgi:hypothetical protein